MRIKLNFSIGWIKGNPLKVFQFEIGSVIEDYPNGWIAIVLFGITIGKFEFAIILDRG